jgi:hypothetical protein
MADARHATRAFDTPRHYGNEQAIFRTRFAGFQAKVLS